MNDYRHILFATDFSEPSRVAAQRAKLEASAHTARLSLIHVIEHFPVGMPTDWVAPENADPATYYRTRAATELAQLAEELEYQDAEQKVIVTASSASHAIVDYARQQQVDLIVTGIRGSWVSGMLGSTAMAVVHQASCDVLLVR